MKKVICVVDVALRCLDDPDLHPTDTPKSLQPDITRAGTSEKNCDPSKHSRITKREAVTPCPGHTQSDVY